MRIIKILDMKNYENHWEKFKRDSVRAIIFFDHKLIMIRSDLYGECKFPGGGIEKNESHAEALARETKEETGLSIIPSSLREYGMTTIIRKSFNKREIFEQDSFYYFCELENTTVSPTKLNEYETEYGYKLVCITIDKAIEVNKKRTNNKNTPWVERELTVLNALKHDATV